MNAIETKGLSHHFSPKNAILQDVNLAVPVGSIYGFLGPNGAGKTTTLRLLLGLLRRQQGSIAIFGVPLERQRVQTLRRIGSSIESPSLYAHLTARENLAIWQTAFACPKRRIEEVLDLVGLAQAGAMRTGQFSLGMKQRLSIAIALLHEPELLILDEPTNGLDPQGIIEMRDLLRTLNRDRQITIVVSSHLLSEVERLITHVGIIHQGSLRFQGTLNELVEKQNRDCYILIDTSDNVLTLQRIIAQGWEARAEAGKIRVPLGSPQEVGALNTHLVQSGIAVHEIISCKKDLEQIFLSLVLGKKL